MIERFISPLLSRYQRERVNAGMEPDEVMTRMAEIVTTHGLIRGRHHVVDYVQDHYFGPGGEYGLAHDVTIARQQARIIVVLNTVGAMYLTTLGSRFLPEGTEADTFKLNQY